MGDNAGDPDRGDRGADPRRDGGLQRDQEAAARRVRRHRRERDRGDVLDSARRLGVRAGPVRDRQRRGGRQHRVLRVAAAAPGRREGSRSRLDRGLCDRVHGRRLAARDQSADDPEARAVRHSGRGRRDAAVAGERRRLVGAVLDSAVPPGARAAGAHRSWTNVPAKTRCAPARAGWAKRSGSCGGTGMRSCSCSRSCSTTTASRR